MRISSQQIQQNYSTLSQGIKNIPQDFSIQAQIGDENTKEKESATSNEIQAEIAKRIQQKDYVVSSQSWTGSIENAERRARFHEEVSIVWNELYDKNTIVSKSDYQSSVQFLEKKMNEILEKEYMKDPHSPLVNNLLEAKDMLHLAADRVDESRNAFLGLVELVESAVRVGEEEQAGKMVSEQLGWHWQVTYHTRAAFGVFFSNVQDTLSPTDKKAVLESLSKMDIYWEKNWNNDWEHMLSDSNQESLQNFIQRGANIGSEVDTTKILFEMFNVTSSESNKKPTQDLESKKQEILSKVKEIKADSQGSLLSQMLSKKA
ncbi:hypothetical protein CCZ01_04090 [Helicobacter monodelphidis]|uniref:hypothetical protein n=1 Tax=Helicobacter sp. 15-1451 TaxID=2004995 RepID=UPI000DCC493D|nr:hypothetical protein [Helicobacter sp. 15-1451]RAX58000.1 hypothetical protein CCZ01_04090 [Helicobacter sp. 15-1451]